MRSTDGKPSWASFHQQVAYVVFNAIHLVTISAEGKFILFKVESYLTSGGGFLKCMDIAESGPQAPDVIL